MRVINRYTIPPTEEYWQTYCDQESSRLALWCMMRSKTKTWKRYSNPLALCGGNRSALWRLLNPQSKCLFRILYPGLAV